MNDAAPPALLGYAPMDSAHAEFDQLLAETLASDDAGMPEAVERLHAHLLSHFGQEDQWMRETNFPAVDCHLAEHAAVLRSARQVLESIAGNAAEGRRFASALRDWFPGHADYLDSALAAWMCKRQYGGHPVVLRSPKGRG